MNAAPRAPLPAVVLAAGGARRFGSAKQLAKVNGEPLVRRAARTAIDAGATPVIVVLGAHAAEVRASLDGVDAVIVDNEEWESGLAGSLALGLAALQRLVPDVEGALLMVADQPLVTASMLRGLMERFPGGDGAAAASYGDVLGVPAAIGSAAFAELMSLRGDRGAAGWLRSNAERVVPVPLPEALLDVDRPDDLAAAIRAMR